MSLHMSAYGLKIGFIEGTCSQIDTVDVYCDKTVEIKDKKLRK